MSNHWANLCFSAFLLGISSNAGAADRPWVEAKSPHFIVVSDAGDKTARDIAWQFEQIRAAIKVAWPWARSDLDRPVVVLAAKDENSMKVLAPQFWEQRNGIKPDSVFVTGADAYYVALRADVTAQDTDSINPYHSAYWSYASLALQSVELPHALPVWLDRGLANLMSNTIVRPSSIQVGRSIPWWLNRLHNGARLPLKSLLTLDAGSPWLSDGDRMATVDAQTWGLVHYFLFADMGTHRDQFNKMVTLLADGKGPVEAFETAFGSVEAIERVLPAYYAQPILLYEKRDADVNIKRDAFASRVLPGPEAGSMRAALHVTMQRPTEARALIAEAKQAVPPIAQPYDVEGRLLERENKNDEARASYAKAMELASSQYYTYYRWAALTLRPDNDQETTTRLDAALNKAVSLNTSFAPSYEMLARVKLQMGRLDEALGLARRAVSLEPAQGPYRLTTALVLWRLERPQEAEKEARTALNLANNDGQRQAAQRLLDFFANPRRPDSAQK
jgi:tetratricopeptide (TPR) repeat protein